MKYNSIFCTDAQVCNNLDVRLKHEHDNIIEQSGRSMIEMLGVLAIVGVLSVGGIAGYSKAMEKFKINKTIDQVSHIVENIRTLYSQQTTYSGLTTEQAIKMGVIPDSLATSNNYPYITNTFNGRVFITEDFYSSTSAFLLHFSGLPKEACIALATSDWGSKNTTGLTAISIGDNYNTGPWNAYAGNCVMDIGGWDNVACPGDSNNPTPVNVTTAATICSQCSNNCSISWRFEQ